MGRSAQLFDLGMPARPAGEAIVQAKRIAEAMLFSAAQPIEEASIAARLPDPGAIGAVMAQLQADYAGRGVQLVRVQRCWLLRTAPDLAPLLAPDAPPPRKLSRAAIETLAIVAYHQPVTRAEVEDIRGIAMAKGTLDVLLETGWVRLRGRRKVPGRPLTYGTTPDFLAHFGLEAIGDLPGLDELKGAGRGPPAERLRRAAAERRRRPARGRGTGRDRVRRRHPGAGRGLGLGCPRAELRSCF